MRSKVEKKLSWNELESSLKKMVVEELHVPPEKVTMNARFIDDLGADSLDNIELVMAAEELFEIEIPNEVAQDWNTLSDALNGYIKNYPADVMNKVDTRSLIFRLLPDGKIQVVLQLEDGSWTYADGTKVLPSSLCLLTFSRWQHVLKELQDLVNDPKTKEEDLQRFFEENPELLAADDYDTVIPQAAISGVDGTPMWKADFVLAPLNQVEFCKILELKLPRMELTNKPVSGHIQFSAKLWHAISQLKDYGRAFDSPKIRERFKGKYGIDVFKPDLHLIAGRYWNMEWVHAIRALRRETQVNIEDWDSALERLKREFL